MAGSRWTEDDYRRELRRIKAARPLHQLQSEALQGKNPVTGRWWPRWREWKPTDRIRQIMSRFTKGPHGSGARWGRVGGRSRSARKVTTARQNGRKSTGRARKGTPGARL